LVIVITSRKFHRKPFSNRAMLAWDIKTTGQKHSSLRRA